MIVYALFMLTHEYTHDGWTTHDVRILCEITRSKERADAWIAQTATIIVEDDVGNHYEVPDHTQKEGTYTYKEYTLT